MSIPQETGTEAGTGYPDSARLHVDPVREYSAWARCPFPGCDRLVQRQHADRNEAVKLVDALLQAHAQTEHGGCLILLHEGPVEGKQPPRPLTPSGPSMSHPSETLTS